MAAVVAVVLARPTITRNDARGKTWLQMPVMDAMRMGVPSVLHEFVNFLKSEQSRGVTHVALDEEARAALRTIQEQARNAMTPRHTGGDHQHGNAAPVESARPAVAPAPPTLDAGQGGKDERIAQLRERAANWQPARNLDTLREAVVFSTGDPGATLALVGEAPGYEDERQGQPFVGPAGKKLDGILKAMGISREQVYITNIVKNRPAMARQATNNRKPDAAEIAAWMPFVRQELAVVEPQCIVALGATAAEGLLGGGCGVDSLRGAWHEFEGIPVRVTYHPSYLLRSEENLSAKRQLWEDMLAVMERLGMPINDKQRGYFLPR